MTRLQRFHGASSLPGVGNPGIVADRAIGDATVQLGRQIGHSAAAAGTLAERARKREDNLKTFSAAIDEERRLSEAKARRVEEHKNQPSEPIGLSKETLAFIKSTEARIQREAPDNPQQEKRNNAFYSKEELLQDFAADAAAESEAYQLKEIERSREFSISEIQQKPERFERSLSRLAALIDIAPLPLAKKKSALQQVRESLAEAWLKTLPIREQIAGLQLLIARRGATGDTDVGAKDKVASQSSNRGRSVAADAETYSTIKLRAQYLPSHKQDQLLADAIKTKVINGNREEARIAALIADDPFSVASQVIHDSEHLEENQRLRLLSGLRERIAEREKELEAIDWFARPASLAPGLSQYNEIAERAYKSVDADPLSKEEFLGALVRNRSPLPNSLLSEISRGIRSHDASEISAAFAKLKPMETLPASLVFNGGTDLEAQKAFVTWKGLTELKGISVGNASSINLYKER